MVTIHDGDAYTSAISNAFATAFGALGGAVPVVAQVKKGQTDMAAVRTTAVRAVGDMQPGDQIHVQGTARL